MLLRHPPLQLSAHICACYSNVGLVYGDVVPKLAGQTVAHPIDHCNSFCVVAVYEESSESKLKIMCDRKEKFLWQFSCKTKTSNFVVANSC